jgi:NAD-dependent dihydropyrimidine dehydrogenase PreA subunit
MTLVGKYTDKTLVTHFGLPASFAPFVGEAALGLVSHHDEIARYSLGGRTEVITPMKLTMGFLMLVFALFELLPRLCDMKFNRFNGLKNQVAAKLKILDPTLPDHLKKREFYQAELIVLEAAGLYLKRYPTLARRMAEGGTDVQWRKELGQIAENCDWVAENPPRTFWEALQLLFMATTIILIESNGHSVSYGRFDQYMHPFYEKDLAQGTVTKEWIQELIKIFFLKDLWWCKLRDRLTVIPNSGRGMGGDSLTMGGVDKPGADATNDLSYMVLDAHANTRSGVPWIAVRLHQESPWEFKVKAINTIRIGTGQPKLFNDQAAIPASVPVGRSLEDSRNYHVVGCVEIDAGGKEYGWHDSAYFSIAKVLELAINNGRCIGIEKYGYCLSACPLCDQGVFLKADDRIAGIDREICNTCLKCADACPANALTVWGKRLSVDDVMKEVLSDLDFYAKSGGGVTVSGGEALVQWKFTMALLKQCRQHGFILAWRRRCTALQTYSTRSILLRTW